MGLDEKIEQVFIGQTGPNPLWVLVTWLVFFRVKYRIFAVTAQGLYVFSASAWMPAKPKKQLELVSPTAIPVPTDMWSKLAIGSQDMWANRRYQKDVQAASAYMSNLVIKLTDVIDSWGLPLRGRLYGSTRARTES